MMRLSAEQTQALIEQKKTMISLKRSGVAEDIRRWILMLSDASSSWVSGQVVGIDDAFWYGKTILP